MECECKTWATDQLALDMLLGHHHNCPKAPSEVAALRYLGLCLAESLLHGTPEDQRVDARKALLHLGRLSLSEYYTGAA